MLRFDANISFLFRELDILDRPRAARAAGFSAIEVISPEHASIEDLAAAIRHEGLTVAACNAPVGDLVSGGEGLSGHPGRRDEFRRAFDAGVAIARAFACDQINIGPSLLTGTDDREACLAVLVDNLGHAARNFDGRILVEPLNRIDYPRVLLAGMPEGLEAVEAAGHERVRLLFDTYHMGLGGEDVVAAIESNLDIIGHVQIADVPGRGPPGTGALAFDRLFAMLRRGGYPGWIGAEYLAAQADASSLDWWRDQQPHSVPAGDHSGRMRS